MIQTRPVIRSITAKLPDPVWTTEELLEASGGRLSDLLREMIRKLGVERRHTVLANYADVLFRGAEPELAVSGSALAVAAARECIARSRVRPRDVGLVLGVTSSPSRLLPSLVCDMFAQMPELPRDAMTLSVEYMGCSAVAKAVDTARWYLSCHPGKLVLVSFMDAITPLSPPLPGTYRHFSEVRDEERQATVDAMHAFLFADATVAMLLGAEGEGPRLGPIQHWTNDLAADAELGTVPDGGSDIPVVRSARRLYTLSPQVTPRGLFYAKHTVAELLRRPDVALGRAADAVALLMHTGSLRILDGLCGEFGVEAGAARAASSYRILRECGNTLGCSVPLMLADPVRRPAGEALILAFGLSFSCGAFTMTIPQGGWSPAGVA